MLGGVKANKMPLGLFNQPSSLFVAATLRFSPGCLVSSRRGAPRPRHRGPGLAASQQKAAGGSQGPSLPLRLSRGLRGGLGPPQSVPRGAGRAAGLPPPGCSSAGDAPESGWIGPFPGSSRCRGTSATSESGSLSPQGAQIRGGAGRRRAGTSKRTGVRAAVGELRVLPPP